jgi:hypothetical protein
MVKGKKAPAKTQVPPPKRRAQPPSEEDLGGGDICSLEEQPSIADDKPLDLRLLYRRATRPPSPPRLHRLVQRGVAIDAHSGTSDPGNSCPATKPIDPMI